ncbi:JAB domain-containing protein [Elongatibacter sediminis]|uniref:DNA repair protein RadC n=1 Tax=Elongatibacter sediminis TaxID=3119006 RepID=A0AAW9RGE1_9GAMM
MTRSQEDHIIENALKILRKRFENQESLTSPQDTKNYLAVKLTETQREQFYVLFLSTRHHVLKLKKLFEGTLDGAAVYPREVVKEALQVNAGAVILCHNHPSGVSEPSLADQAITRRIKEALGTVDIRVLDHFVVAGGECISMAERGLV